MSAHSQRLADAVARVRRHRVVADALSFLRRVIRHPAWRRAGCFLTGLLPPAVTARWRRVTRGRHAEIIRYTLPLAIVFVLAAFWAVYDHVREEVPGDVSLPDFTSIEQTAQRKGAFLEFMQPIARHENARIRQQREQLLDILDDLESGDDASAYEHAWLAEKADDYRVKAEGDLERARRLRGRIDIVPISLTLAQAALESAWGTSRFARQGNNLFGQWCFEPGCGIVPKHRPERETYEVEAFDTVGESVRSYMQNINSHPAYAPVRRIRAAARSEGRKPTGIETAAGLINYAAIGEKYVEHIRTVIRRNELHKLASAD